MTLDRPRQVAARRLADVAAIALRAVAAHLQLAALQHQRVSGQSRWRPAGSKNFALLGQFVEIPDGIVFTTEYSVLGAIHAVKEFVKSSLVVPPMYFGQYHPLTAIAVARALVR